MATQHTQLAYTLMKCFKVWREKREPSHSHVDQPPGLAVQKCMETTPLGDFAKLQRRTYIHRWKYVGHTLNICSPHVQQISFTLFNAFSKNVSIFPTHICPTHFPTDVTHVPPPPRNWGLERCWGAVRHTSKLRNFAVHLSGEV